jgi:hypothetical protein
VDKNFVEIHYQFLNIGGKKKKKSRRRRKKEKKKVLPLQILNTSYVHD